MEQEKKKNINNTNQQHQQQQQHTPQTHTHTICTALRISMAIHFLKKKKTTLPQTLDDCPPKLSTQTVIFGELVLFPLVRLQNFEKGGRWGKLRMRSPIIRLSLIILLFLELRDGFRQIEILRFCFLPSLLFSLLFPSPPLPFLTPKFFRSKDVLPSTTPLLISGANKYPNSALCYPLFPSLKSLVGLLM